MNYVMIAIGVILAAVVNMAVGMLWYSPTLFGSAWQKLSNVTTFDPKKMQVAMVGGTLSAVVMAAIMACFMYRLKIDSLLSAFDFGWMAWLAFVAPVILQAVLYENMPLKKFAINAGYNLVAIVAMSLTLYFFI
jgi:hypothetical protein